MIAMEVMELFTALESNQAHEVEDVKHKFHEQFNSSELLFIVCFSVINYSNFFKYPVKILIKSNLLL